MAYFTNKEIADLLREVATAYTLKKANIFQIRAYETAADAVEHLDQDIATIREQGQLEGVPGIGESIASHLDELFKTGNVKHWTEIKAGLPQQVFAFINIPGVGPKTALELANLGAESLEDLKKKLTDRELVNKGFSEKIAEKVLLGIQELANLQTERMLLPYAYNQAELFIEYMKQFPEVLKIDVLGSLRRMVSTVGDLDFSIATNKPEKVVKHISESPQVFQVINEGKFKVTVIFKSGIHADFLLVEPIAYGSLLQHFTGSKLHNIHLRSIAEEKGFSLSEYGVKNKKTGKIVPTKTENDFYKILGMDTPPPEIREDTGEIEASLAHKLPRLIEYNSIKGDLHLHSNFSLEPSHGPGENSIEEIIKNANLLEYEYIGIADHPPGFTTHTKDQIKKLIRNRTKYIEQLNNSSEAKRIRVLNLLEVDILPDGSLSVDDEILKTLDFAIAGVHSLLRMNKSEMTKRILKALENQYVKVLAHPTGRILNQREGYEVEWEKIFNYAEKNQKAMEINAYPDRLDLSDYLIRKAKEKNVKLVIDTDSHSVSQMTNIKFGIATARRGWAEYEDVVNSWSWTKFSKWFKIAV